MSSTTASPAEVRASIASILPTSPDGAVRAAASSSADLAAALSSVQRARLARDTRESLHPFIMRKREILRLELSLEAKRCEIRKLHSAAAARTSALESAELQLEEESLRFEAFLTASDAAARAALARAEAQGRLRQEGAAKLKQGRAMLSAASSEHARLVELAAEHERYRVFLEALTPVEWSAAREAEAAAAAEARRVARFAARLSEWSQTRDAKTTEVRAALGAERSRLIALGRKAPQADLAAVLAAALPPAPTLESEPRAPARWDGGEEGEEAAGGEAPLMFFTEPVQLLSLFTSMADANLALIQRVAKAEQALAELRAQKESQPRAAATSDPQACGAAASAESAICGGSQEEQASGAEAIALPTCPQGAEA